MAEHERRCTATSKRTGERCQRIVRVGAMVCATHGGSARQVAAAAARRAELESAEVQARRLLADAGPMTREDVYEELLRTGTLIVQMRDVAREKFEALMEWRYMALGAGTEQLRAEVGLYERMLNLTAKHLEAFVKLDIQARVTHISESQGDLVAIALGRIFDQLDLTPEQQALIPVIVPMELRRVADGRR